MNDILGVVYASSEKGSVEDSIDPLAAVVQPLLVERTQARAEGNWARADEIRDELAALKVEIMDTPEGPKWKRIGNL